MAGVAAACAVAATVVAAGVATAVVSKNAADKAAGAQKKGVEQQNQLLGSLRPERLDSIAQDFDKQRAQNRIAFQKEIDPELAALRTQGKEQLLAQAQKAPELEKSNQLAQTLFNETKQQDPRIEALKQSLITNAEKDLAAGATLPPEFQGELVRAGLNQGAQAGIGVGAPQIGGSTARLLGIAGIQLQQQRQQEAINATNAAQGITNARVNILASVFPKLRDLESVNRQDAVTNFQIGDSTLPEVGLSGREAVNLELARKKSKAALLQQGADIKAGQAISQGNFTSGLIGAGASGVTAGIGAYAGAPAAAIGTQPAYGSNPAARTPQQQQFFSYLQNGYE